MYYSIYLRFIWMCWLLLARGSLFIQFCPFHLKQSLKMKIEKKNNNNSHNPSYWTSKQFPPNSLRGACTGSSCRPPPEWFLFSYYLWRAAAAVGSCSPSSSSSSRSSSMPRMRISRSRPAGLQAPEPIRVGTGTIRITSGRGASTGRFRCFHPAFPHVMGLVYFTGVVP